MAAIKTGQVCKVTGWGTLLDEDVFNRIGKPLNDYPSVNQGETVVILGEFRTGADEYKARHEEYIHTEDIQFVKVLLVNGGTGWISTGYLESIVE